MCFQTLLQRNEKNGILRLPNEKRRVENIYMRALALRPNSDAKYRLSYHFQDQSL